jgi:hypothetical protein
LLLFLSRAEETPKEKAKERPPEKEDKTNEIETNEMEIEEEQPEIAKPEMEKEEEEEEPEDKGKENKTSKKTSKKRSSKSAKKKALFKGVTFLITGLKVDKEEDNSGELESTVCKFIRAAGGRILGDIRWKSSVSVIKRGFAGDLPATVLIADKPRRTMKYLLALAAGVPCVKYNWIQDCEKEVL